MLWKKAFRQQKNHIKAILAGMDKTFPLHLWDGLLPQAEVSLNMLLPSSIRAQILAYAYMYGHHDDNQMPLAPIGCAVLVHNKLSIRESWDPSSIDSYYSGTSRNDYWCFNM